MFEIVTDSCCNLGQDLIEKFDIRVIPMTYIIDGKEHLSYLNNRQADLQSYYMMMRDKVSMSTASVNGEDCRRVFERALKNGRDLIYVGFSSVLSSTFAIAHYALGELRAKYPERTILAVDSLSGSLGQGKLIVSAAQMAKNGADIHEVYSFLQQNKLNMCHLFTVDNLSYLYKGGRVSKSAYLVANTLKIKPILHVNNDGYMEACGKVLGRKASLNSLADKLSKTIVNPQDQTVYISHADCQEDVNFLVEKIAEKTDVKGFYVNHIDLVIGVHAGPDSIAVFYYADQR